MRISFWLLILSIGLSGCRSSSNRVEESMVAGHAVIGTSDATFNLAWRLSSVFQSNSPAAFIDIVRAPNFSLIDSLLNERTEEIFLDRPPMPAETLAFHHAELKLFTYPIAYSPVFLLIRKENNLLAIDSSNFRSILSGKIGKWSEIGGDEEPIELFCQLSGEGSLEAVLGFYNSPDTIVASECSTLVRLFEAGSKSPGSLLISPVLPDTADFKPLRFEREGFSIPANVETILTPPRYPFMLTHTYITTHNKGDVAAGYLTFIMGNTGQREVMRRGLRPAVVPVRIVRVKS